MKKVLFVLALMMAVLVVNAQATRTVVKVADLQKVITDNITKDYAGYTIKDATKVTLNNVVTYEVVVVKGTLSEMLVYDKDGKFIEKMAVPEVTPKANETMPVVVPDME